MREPNSELGLVLAKVRALSFGIKDKMLKLRSFLRSLVLVEKLPVHEGQQDVRAHEEEDFSVDELVEGALPFEEQPGEAASRRAGDVPLVRNRHLASKSGAEAGGRGEKPETE